MIASKFAKLLPNQLLPLPLVGQRFCSYFPYLFNWIYSKRERIDWRTETRYPLTARILWEKHQDKRQIVGVRFGAQTQYAMVDIDRKSPYHPYNSRANFKKVVDAIADLGLYEYVTVRSSASQGIHLYYPIEYQVSTFDLACGLRHVLQSHGLEVANGILECFPNTKSYNSEYNAHRLPLQDASWILHHDFEPYSNSLDVFCNLWDRAKPCQDLEMLLDYLAIARRDHKANYKNSAKLNDWQVELENIIAQGWTGNGQTNDLLHKVCQYARVFLGFTDLENAIKWVTDKVMRLNGFNQYCSHKTDLLRRVRDWCKWVFAKNYPMADKDGGKEVATGIREKRLETIQRIRDAANSLGDRLTSDMPIREMAKRICKQAGCSQSTLYQNLSLWHPEYKDCVTANTIDSQADLDAINQQSETPESQSTSVVTQINYEVLGADSIAHNSSNFGATGFAALSPIANLMKTTKRKLLEQQIKARKIGTVTPDGLREIEKLEQAIRDLE